MDGHGWKWFMCADMCERHQKQGTLVIRNLWFAGSKPLTHILWYESASKDLQLINNWHLWCQQSNALAHMLLNAKSYVPSGIYSIPLFKNTNGNKLGYWWILMDIVYLQCRGLQFTHESMVEMRAQNCGQCSAGREPPWMANCDALQRDDEQLAES